MTDETTMQNGNPYDLIDHNNTKGGSTNSESKPAEQFLTKIIKKIAKMAGLPDPETGKPFTDDNNVKQAPANSNTTLEQDVVAKEQENSQEEEKKKFNFDNIMSGVTGVLDKIGKKVSEKTGIDLNNPLKKKEDTTINTENNTNPTQTPEPQTSETTENSKTVQEPTPKNEVEKNNEEYLSENH